MSSGHMNFFKINECGLYKVGKESPHGCEIEETFDLIMDWVKGRPLSQTIPWDPNNKRGSKTDCYCREIYKSEETGDFLLVLWKSEADGAGKIWGASEDTTEGKGEIVEYTNEYKGKKVIWGRPCYYWVIPELKSIISIKFDNSVCDSSMLQDWITGCITNRVQHPNKEKHQTPHGYVRLSFTDTDEESPYRYLYKFSASLRSLNTSSVQLSELARKVTHIIRRETIVVRTQDERASWVKKFDSLPYLAPKPKSGTRKIEVKAEAKPTAVEIKQIIEKYANDSRGRSDWDNVGFETESGTVTWVNRYRLIDYINVPSDSPSVLPAKFLYEKLAASRAQYLEPIAKSDEQDSQSAAS
ncbi:hypothetical protein [Pseudomonas tohonis]|uniref:hypothetical protein n=1 Tax=Pseudomonas tohonis TaxID=2725477 RepID=UPI001F48E575|nr:hypothetical protein [Pseudomonas tohonis]